MVKVHLESRHVHSIKASPYKMIITGRTVILLEILLIEKPRSRHFNQMINGNISSSGTKISCARDKMHREGCNIISVAFLPQTP